MIGVLCVAEKPSLAAAIAKLLSGGSSVERHGSQSVHEFVAAFEGHDAQFQVTSVLGHVYSADFDGQYQNWDLDPALLFDAPIVRKGDGRICAHLQQCAKACHHLVLWLDCDREGENICFEVMDNTVRWLQPARGKQVHRARFSAVTAESISKAMATLGDPNEHESLAVDARQELDLKVGVAFTRFQTRYFQGKYGGFDSTVISYGPCQTPTLGFCVGRHIQILEFKPEHFWTLRCTARPENQPALELQWSRGRIFEHEVTVLFQKMIMDGGSVCCQRVATKAERKVRPSGLNTVEMLKIASRGLGIGPHHAMQIAERLYMQGFISYPRTESTGYPPGSDVRSLLQKQAEHAVWGADVSELLKNGPMSPRRGVDVGDHPPITPMRVATENQLDWEAWRLYEFISRNFIASLSPDCLYTTTKLEFIGSASGSSLQENFTPEVFTASGRTVTQPGFTKMLPHLAVEDTLILLKEVRVGDVLPLDAVTVQAGQTSPPGYLTEADLITLMEKHGIGTDASIATHIENIGKRKYVKVGPGRTMVPTELGVVLIQGLARIDPDLALPTVRGYVEAQLNLIASGSRSISAVVPYVLNQFYNKFKYYVRKIGLMDSLFEASFSANIAKQAKRFTKCGKTGLILQLIPSRPPSLYNRKTEEMYPLPLGGLIKPYNGQLCPVCAFELMLYSVGQKNYPLCPWCYNFPSDTAVDQLAAQKKQQLQKLVEEAGKEDMRAELQRSGNKESGGGGEEGDGEEGGGEEGSSASPLFCTTCPMSEFHPALSPLVVCACPESWERGGALILDPTGGPNWRLISTRSNLMVLLPQGARTIRVLQELDSATQCRYLQIDFHKLRSPLGPNATRYKGLLGEGLLAFDSGLITQTYARKGKGGRGGKKKGKGGKGKGGKGKGGKPGNRDEKMSFNDF